MKNSISRTILLGLFLGSAGSLSVGGESTKLAEATSTISTPTLAESGSIKGVFNSLARVKTKGETSQRDVVVYLKAAEERTHEAPSSPVVVLQEKLNFSPHVIPVLKGTKVQFKNADSVPHNVYSGDSCCSIDTDMEKGNTSEMVYSEAGLSTVVCRLHTDMSLWILVLENPWFQHFELEKTKEESGSRYHSDYELKDVPAGEYTLTFWNKKLKPLEFPISVEAGKVTSFDIQIPKK